ncbi:hypothetical protein BROC_01376 [Candidatus Brocadiaceae bacterium]|nr:hypothetical protein BROC_01376 [Candidatus Brocadiaceae bacterium]
MSFFKSIGKVLAGGKRQKGERLADYNARSHEAYRHDWISEKKSSGKWLSKEEYEKKTGRPGRKG